MQSGREKEAEWVCARQREAAAWECRKGHVTGPSPAFTCCWSPGFHRGEGSPYRDQCPKCDHSELPRVHHRGRALGLWLGCFQNLFPPVQDLGRSTCNPRGNDVRNQRACWFPPTTRGRGRGLGMAISAEPGAGEVWAEQQPRARGPGEGATPA